MARTFRHEGEDWSVSLSGSSSGTGSVLPPPTTSWGIVFFRLDDPATLIYGHARTGKLDELTDDQLRECLHEAIQRNAP